MWLCELLKLAPTFEAIEVGRGALRLRRNRPRPLVVQFSTRKTTSVTSEFLDVDNKGAYQRPAT
jgi:hypothetical protein